MEANKGPKPTLRRDDRAYNPCMLEYKMVNLLLLVGSLLAHGFPPQSQAGVVTGQLLNRDGTPAVGVRVAAMAVPESGVPVPGASTLVGLTQTDSAGRYRLENVPPG